MSRHSHDRRESSRFIPEGFCDCVRAIRQHGSFTVSTTNRAVYPDSAQPSSSERSLRPLQEARSAERGAMLPRLAKSFGDALKAVGGFIARIDISVSVLEGKFELNRSGA